MNSKYNETKVKNIVCLVLAFIVVMSVLMLASAQEVYAANKEPKDLRWNTYLPYRAEWEWTDLNGDLSRLDVTVKFEPVEGSEATLDTFTYQNYAIDYNTKDGVTKCDFDGSDIGHFFRSHGEGYYSFYLDAYYSEGADPQTVSSDRVHYREIAYHEDILGPDGEPYEAPNQVNRDVRFSIDQENDDHYYIIAPDDPVVLPAGKIVRIGIKSEGMTHGFRAAGFVFDPEPSALTTTDEKASFTLDKNTSVHVRIMQDVATVPVTIDFGTGHEDVAVRTAEEIKNPEYPNEYPAYETEVSGSKVIIPKWPQATKVNELKELVAARLYEANEIPGYIFIVFDDESCFREGKIGRKAVSEYSGTAEYEAEKTSDKDADIPDEGIDLYVLWDKIVSEASFTVEAPLCGTVVALDGNDQTPSPVVRPDKGCLVNVRDAEKYWLKDGARFSGTMTGGESYTASFAIEEPLGIYFGVAPEDRETVTPVVKVNGSVVQSDYADYPHFDIEAVHTWDDGEITKEPTETEEGVKTFTCMACKETRTEAVPKLDPTPKPEPEPDDRSKQTGEDGTKVGKGASAEVAEAAIKAMKSDKDPKGSKIAPLFLKSTKQTNNSVKLTWKKPAGAVKYVLYGNKCGKKCRMKRLRTTTKNSLTIKKAVKKLKKGKAYKFILVSLDRKNNVVSTSKVIHVFTKGGKVTNAKAVRTNAKKNKVTLKKGKTFTIKTKVVKASKKLKYKKLAVIRYESSKTSVATVTKKGKITAKAKGSCYVYAYAQNGALRKIRVTVR